jgi:histidyl-tRNA synthetase
MKQKTKKPKLKKKIFQAPKGMRDILPSDQPYWEKIYRVAKELAAAYGFGKIDTPILEDAELFVKATGETTDIVEKQMYTMRTKGGDVLALRPEFTPGVIRAYLEGGLSSLPQPVKLYSCGPLFRHERPQAGRYRQFHQFNLEIIGSASPVSEAQIINFFFILFKEIGLKNINLQINSIGCRDCRPAYRKALVNYYFRRTDRACSNCKKRLKQNPLRLLDCKEEKCAQLISGAPQVIDSLCEECHNHFKGVLEFLDELEVPYILNPYLVRGLDYYSKTVFEFCQENDEARQGAFGGGGRYDYLVKMLGGKDGSACGGACGLERIVILMKEQNTRISSVPAPKVFLIQLGDLAKRKSLLLFEELRKANVTAVESSSKDSIKTQLKLADKMGVKFVLILGQQEVLDKTVIIRDMQTGVQETIKQEKLIKELKKRLSKK